MQTVSTAGLSGRPDPIRLEVEGPADELDHGRNGTTSYATSATTARSQAAQPAPK